MSLIGLVGLVFVVVFGITAVLLAASGFGTSKELKETLARLDAVSLTARQKTVDEMAVIRRQEILSTLPWLDRALRRIDLFGRIHRLIVQADLRWTVGGLLLASFFLWGATTGLVWLRTGVFLFSLLLGAVGGIIPWAYLYYKRNQRFVAFEQQLPEALDLIVSALRAGHGLTMAMGHVGKEMPDPVAKEFRQCFEEQNFGLELRTAIGNLVERVPTQDMRFIATAVLVQKETGGNLAEILERVAAIIRERFRLKREIRVRTAQGRLTGWVLVSSPIVFAVLVYLVRPDFISVLWTKPLGLKMLYTASIMMAIGVLVIRRIVNPKI